MAPAGTNGTRYLLVANNEFWQDCSRDSSFEASYGKIEAGIGIVEVAPEATIGETERPLLRAEDV